MRPADHSQETRQSGTCCECSVSVPAAAHKDCGLSEAARPARPAPAHPTMSPPPTAATDAMFGDVPLQRAGRRRRPRMSPSQRSSSRRQGPSSSALSARRATIVRTLLLVPLLLLLSSAESTMTGASRNVARQKENRRLLSSADSTMTGAIRNVARQKENRRRDPSSGIRRRRADSDDGGGGGGGGGDNTTSISATNATIPISDMEAPSTENARNAPEEPSSQQETDSPTLSSGPPTPEVTSYSSFSYFDVYDDSMDGASPRPRNEKQQEPPNYTVNAPTASPTKLPWLRQIAPTRSPGNNGDISGRQQNGDGNGDDNGVDIIVTEEVSPPLTDAPASAAPTPGPSVEPTDEPTMPPSDEPTRAPTSTPSRSPTDAPTFEPSSSPITASPTELPTPLPTAMPQVYPTTQYPTKQQSKSPSALPTTASPTVRPTTAAPTPIPVPEPTATPTLQPSSVPTATPTPAPTLPIQQFLVELEFVFDDLRKLEDSSIILWEEVTADQIYDHLYWTSNEIGMEEFIGMGVNTRIRRQIQGIPGNGPPGQVASGRGGERKGRRLQTDTGSGGSGAPLTVISVNVIKFKSPREYTQTQIEDHVAKAFNSDSDREKYIANLKATNDRSFRSINTVVVIMDGAPVPEAPTPAPTLNGGGKSNEGINIWLIVGPLIGGVLFVAAIVILVISRRQKKRKKAFMAHAYDGTRVSKFVDVENNNDDISTLGDPVYPAGAMFSSAPDVKDTADNSIVSADYDYKRALGTNGDAPTAATPKSDEADRSQGSGSGRATLSTMTGGLGKMDASLFDDDASFEKQYREPEERIEIDAPAGRLGVVIDTPVGGVPVVHAIKDTSILAEKVRVGDQLISVDDVDCTQLSAIEVSKLISSRAQNPSR
eukprot:CAMPEP_0178609130 /NCGR_PEP_ID=MMETSP0697-20121206/38493_1 /TAXON_ID=265572 /ORGANISM="Extubocellulus spinifer, Strain CCMP396" /LENGTH=883 /DNA_ID=CAMNT_0020247707 /DNA_START=308 /DNA_END=2956 /DNA_ORIENTATION=-